MANAHDAAPRPGFTGLFVPMVTPMRPDGGIDDASTASLARHFADTPGVAGLVTGARIGEGPVLSFEEHVAVTRAVREGLGPDYPIIASILPRSAEDGARQSEALAEAGADALMVFPPLLLAWGQVPERVKVAFWEDLAAASALPLLLFQIPLSNYWYEPATCAEIAQLDQVISMKEASFDMRRYSATVEAVRDAGAAMTILNGNDRFVAEGALLGAEGALIGIANLLPEGWAEILRLAAEHRAAEAVALQKRLHRLQELIFCEPILDAVARIKVVLAHEGVIAHPHVRRPQLGVGEEERQALLEGYRSVQESIDIAAAQS